MRLQKKLSDISLIMLAALLAASCDNGKKPAEINNTVTDNAVSAPAVISYDIIKEYPHDPGAFTEGLEFRNGVLYESTGQYGRSDIRKVNPETGKVLLSKKMDGKYFGEGLTIVNGKLFQLTYREGKGFVYDTATLKLEKTFVFNAPEGWGMTNNGACLIYDDGTNVLHFLDPNTFREVKHLDVADEHGPVNEINEPEMIHGFIYANQWKTDNILKIDTGSGRVVGIIDLSNLRQRAGIAAPTGNPNGPDVLNGIAYDAEHNRMFITGKNWPKLFEIKITPAP